MNKLNNDEINLEQLAEIRNEYTNLVDYLKELMFKKHILDSPSYAELSRKLGFRYNWIKEKKSTMKEGHFPKKETFDDLYQRLSDRYMEQLDKSWDVIKIKFNVLYTISFSTKKRSVSDLKTVQISIKREFFNDIIEIAKLHFPNTRIFDADISRLFLRGARALKDSHLKGDLKFRKLELSTLFNFIYKMKLLTKEDLINKIRDIEWVDEKNLQNFKADVENFIEEFIFSNPFERKYISDAHYTGTRYFKPEYDLAFKVWFELSKAKKKLLLLKNVQKILKYESFGRINRFGEPTRGKVYSWKGLMNVLNELTKHLPSNSFSRTFEHIWRYIEWRNLSPSPPSGEYHPQWYNPKVVKFHVIILIIRDLGLDILNLKPIKPEALKKIDRIGSFTYQRHHIFVNDKMSIDANRLALVMRKYHHDLEGKTNLILSLIKSRIGLAVECPQYYITTFGNWKERWGEYLKRRCFLIENGIENFIIKYFTDNDGHNYIIERFFKDIPRGNIEREIGFMIHDWINLNRPYPILNKHIFKRLLCGSSNLLTRGFIQYKS